MCDKNTKNEKVEESTPTKQKVLPTIKLILEIMGLLTSVFVMISYLSDLSFQRECERFYGIKGDFFSTDIRPQIADMVSYFLLLVLFAYPAYGRSIDKRKTEESEKKGVLVYYSVLAIVFGGMFGLVNLGGILKIPFVYEKFVNDTTIAIVLIVVALVCGVVTIMGLTLSSEISLIKKKKGAICYYVWFACAYLMLVAYLGQILFALSDSIENKRDYEFVLNAEKQYVVLENVGDEVLVVEYFRNNELDEVIFYTKSYTFLTRNEYSYAYGYLDKPPIIKYEIKPEENTTELLSEGE